VILPDAARELLALGRLAHLITINTDGSPQVTAVWVGLDGDQIMIGHTGTWQKVRNIRRDPRVALTMDAGSYAPSGAQHSLVVYGTAQVTDGGAYFLLARLARRYLDEHTARAWVADRFPGGADAQVGHVVRITPLRVAGLGPWNHVGPPRAQPAR
jgi:PPOX class probable F420-dependent enzyme